MKSNQIQLLTNTMLAIALIPSSASAVGALLSCDFTGDGFCDAADYPVWRDSYQQVGSGLAADANQNTRIDIVDYEIWKANFGLAAGAGNGMAIADAPSSTVPEPSTIVLAVLALIMCGGIAKAWGAS